MKVDEIVEKIVLAGYLKRYRRMGNLLFLNESESIAAHIFRVAYITFELGGPVREALWHDFQEAYTLDHYPASKRFLEVKEESVSDVVKDADLLETLVTVWELHPKDEHLWYERMVPLLRSREARDLWEEVERISSLSAFHRLLRTKERLTPAERILLAGLLKKLPRSGWFTVGIKDPETVADHTFRVMIIADLLSPLEGFDPEEEVKRALLHDLPEAITGDHHKLAKMHVTAREEKVWEFIGISDPGVSPVLKDADKLELIATAMEYKSVGVKGLERWIEIAKGGLRLDTSREVAEVLEDVVLGDYYVNLLSNR